MIAYEAIGPTSTGDFIIGYPTPGAPHIITATGRARTKQAAEQECARLNDERARAEAALVADRQYRIRGGEH